MGFFDKLFPQKKDAHDHHDHDHHGHVHLDCPTCGKHFHTQAEYDAHLKSAHGE